MRWHKKPELQLWPLRTCIEFQKNATENNASRVEGKCTGNSVFDPKISGETGAIFACRKFPFIHCWFRKSDVSSPLFPHLAGSTSWGETRREWSMTSMSVGYFGAGGACRKCMKMPRISWNLCDTWSPLMRPCLNSISFDRWCHLKFIHSSCPILAVAGRVSFVSIVARFLWPKLQTRFWPTSGGRSPILVPFQQPRIMW